MVVSWYFEGFKMHSKSLVSIALLAASAVAAPTRQHPLVHEKNPYNLDNRDPYDHKVDSYGEGFQPLPMVSGKTPYHHERLECED